MSQQPEGTYPYPQQVPDCIDQSSEAFAQQCEGCPFGPECGYLAVAGAVIEARQETQTLIANQYEQTLQDNRDKILPGFYNSRAIEAMITHDTEIATELVDGRSAIIMIDIRGLHAVNEKYNMKIGDSLLVESATRLTASPRGVRASLLERQDVEGERRQSLPSTPDLGIREGKADEMYVLLRNVLPSDLQILVDRVQDVFSVDRAIHDAAKNSWPIPASISYIHAAEISQEDATEAVEIFRVMFEAVKDRHEGIKSHQYSEMWQKVCEARHEKNLHVPGDARMIYDEFIMTCCKDFVRRMARHETARKQ